MTHPAKTTPATYSYEEALEDVHTRFILNLPDTELQRTDRIFFQLEQAWWFYEDWICDPHPEWNLPRFSNFKPFACKLFEYSPLLPNVQEFPAQWAAFGKYKRTISNYGCILLNEACTRVLLCRVWNGKSYSFPAGKINQGEDGRTAAARETYEETGFDPVCKFGLTAAWQQQSANKITWSTEMPEQDTIVYTEDSGKRRTSYVIAGVPEDFPFEPVARKEVSEVAFFDLDDLPKASYGVVPFLGNLKKWIRKYRKSKGLPPLRNNNNSRGRNSRGRNSRSRGGATPDALVTTGLIASVGEEAGWSEEAMFAANAKLLGRQVEYDGNPHNFAADSVDPHAFHVVGGGFLNAPSSSSSSPGTNTRVPLPNTDIGTTTATGGDDLKPFFANDGSTPWGDVVQEVATTTTTTKKKRGAKRNKYKMNDGNYQEQLEREYEQDCRAIQEWVDRLPKPPTTKHFGTFRLDVDRIMAATKL